ncbi:MAG: hypothetical protein GF355_08100 [Candidatus Eisenbacteria bacterium]|nr:hypothetical protein [Candidatus Eisenbacteria bacterium]
MQRRQLQTDQAPAAIGPYVQGVRAGELVFTSMQIALDPRSGELVGKTATEQARQCLENVQAVVAAAGLELRHIVKVTVYLTDLAQFGPVNEIYAGYFPGDRPARAVVEVRALPKDALVGVEAIAAAS